MFHHDMNKALYFYSLELALNSCIHKYHIKIVRRDESLIGKVYSQYFTYIVSSPAMVKHKIMFKIENNSLGSE